MKSVDPNAIALPPAVRKYVCEFIARKRRTALYRAVGIALAFALSWMLAWCLVDRILHLPAGMRMTLLVMNLAAVVILVFRPVRQALRREVDWAEAAADIERRHGSFAERLQTVTTQMLSRPELRGSPHMLEQLLREVDRDLASVTAAGLIPWRVVAAPWLAGAAVTLIIVLLAPVPGLSLPRLMARFLRPMAPIDPVTTTALLVEPGDTSVVQGSPLTLKASASPMSDTAPILHWSEDGKSWSQEPMEPTSDHDFAYSLAAVDREFHYYVTGGDAQSHLFRVIANRRPAVASFRIRYLLPSYTFGTRKPQPITVSNTDGMIEALVGTEVTLDVIATDPLKEGNLTLGERNVALERTVEPSVLQAKFKIEHDAAMKLSLVSARDVHGDGPANMAVRAVPDQPPIVRVIQPAGEVRLAPRDLLDVQYIASDDYGVTALWLQEQVNFSAERKFPIALHGDPRYQPGTFAFDLATLTELQMGDIVRIALIAEDGAGHRVASEARYITIAPRSIDVKTHLRLAEARQAAALARELNEQLTHSLSTLDKARSAGADTHDPNALSSIHESLSSADETAAALRQALLRTVVQSDSPELTQALAKWADEVQIATSTAEEADRLMDSVAQQPSRNKIAAAMDRVKPLSDQLSAVAAGQEAQIILAELQDVKSAASLPAKAGMDAKGIEEQNRRLARFVKHTHQDIDADAAELKLKPSAPDFESQLQHTIAIASSVTAAQHPVDFAAAAGAWVTDLAQPAHQQPPLESRLVVAAKAEAIRGDGDLVHARDLELEARAAARVESQTAEPREQPGALATTRPAIKPAQFPPAVAALQKEHELTIAGEAKYSAGQIQSARQAAMAARTMLKAWTDAAEINPAEAELPRELEANAAMAKEDYARAELADKAAEKAAADKAAADKAAARSALSSAGSSRTPSDATDALARADQPAVPTDQRDAPSADAALRDKLAQRVLPAGAARRSADMGRRVASDEMRKAEKLSSLRKAQDQLRADTAAVNRTNDQQQLEIKQALARRQQDVADQVKQVAQARQNEENPADDEPEAQPLPADQDEPNARGDEMAAIQAAQERLAAMPQQLTDAEEATAARAAAATQSGAAEKALAQAKKGDSKDAAGRVAEQAAKNLTDAVARQKSVAAPLDPDAADALAQSVLKFAPETTPAADAIEKELTPSLREMRQAMSAGDAATARDSATQARHAIAAAQVALRQAQNALIERDPIASARYYTQEAANDLAQRNADLQTAGQHEERASQALGKAWDRSVHASAGGRLAQVPALAALIDEFNFDSISDAIGDARASEAAAMFPALPSAREWGHLHSREDSGINASLREADPPGYEDSLSAYFEALSKAKGEHR